MDQALDDPLPPGLSQWRRRRLVLLDEPSALLLGLPTEPGRRRRWDPAEVPRTAAATSGQAPKRRPRRKPPEPPADDEDQGLDPCLSRAHPDERHAAEPFVMLWPSGLPRLLGLVRDGRLEPEDLAVLLAMASVMQLRASGRVEATHVELAQLMQCPPDRVEESLGRLERAGVVVPWERPRARVRLGYLVDPGLVSQGSASCRGFALTVFAEGRQRFEEGGAAPQDAKDESREGDEKDENGEENGCYAMNCVRRQGGVEHLEEQIDCRHEAIATLLQPSLPARDALISSPPHPARLPLRLASPETVWPVHGLEP